MAVAVMVVLLADNLLVLVVETAAYGGVEVQEALAAILVLVVLVVPAVQVAAVVLRVPVVAVVAVALAQLQMALHVVKPAGVLVVEPEFMDKALMVLPVLAALGLLVAVEVAAVVEQPVQQQQTGVTPVLVVISVVVVAQALGDLTTFAVDFNALLMFSALVLAAQSVLSGLVEAVEHRLSLQLA